MHIIFFFKNENFQIAKKKCVVENYSIIFRSLVWLKFQLMKLFQLKLATLPYLTNAAAAGAKVDYAVTFSPWSIVLYTMLPLQRCVQSTYTTFFLLCPSPQIHSAFSHVVWCDSASSSSPTFPPSYDRRRRRRCGYES